MDWSVITGDCRETMGAMESDSVRTCITSPPYFGLRDYGHDGQIGLEDTPQAFVDELVDVFRVVRRVLTDDGTVWLNLGDTFCTVPHGKHGANAPQGIGGRAWENRGQGRSGPATGTGTAANRKPLPGLKHKDLIGIPWRVALALQADGWYLRSDIIWHKPNPMPESVTDRPTKAHEYLFLLSKAPQYFYDQTAVAERTADGNTRNKRSVWSVKVKPFKGAHFATFPTELIEPCVLAGSEPGDTVLDPFAGAGTTGIVALRHGRDFVGCELNPDYAEMARERIIEDAPLMNAPSER